MCSETSVCWRHSVAAVAVALGARDSERGGWRVIHHRPPGALEARQRAGNSPRRQRAAAGEQKQGRER